MNTTLPTFFATIFICALAAAPLRAQTNPPAQTGMTNDAVTNPLSQGTTGASPATQSPSVHVNLPGISYVVGANSRREGDDFTRTIDSLIPITGIVMGCAIPIVIVGLSLYFRHRKNIMLHETLRAMIDKGMTIPPELLDKSESDPFKRPRDDLRTGLILMGLGAGAAIFLHNRAGFVLLLMGVAFLAASFLERKNKNNGQPPKP
jgi:hypothetical protein